MIINFFTKKNIYSNIITMYKSLGSKAYHIGKTLGTKAFHLGPSLGSKINPTTHIANHIIKSAVDIGSHKILDAFSPTNTKRIK